MRVWLLHIGERIALDGDVRLGRYSYLSESLISQGHEVVRWVPSFVHVLKKQRSHTTTDVFLSDHHKVKIVRNPAYKRNVSIRHGISYRILARHIKQLLDAEPEPDVIVAAIPTVGITRVVQDYAEKRGIPVVVDVRDLWPDIFLSAVPPYLRLPGRF